MRSIRRILKVRSLRKPVIYFLACCLLFNTSLPVVLADEVPGMIEGENVVHGVAGFNTVGNTTTITTTHSQTIIEYNRFNIDAGKIVDFVQPGISAATLNRIVQANPSLINGALTSNGRIFIINPAGIIFGPGSNVNVNQLVASGLKMTNDDFLNATRVVDPLDMRFESLRKGPVENYGTINASDSVYLVGKNVLNAGTIISPGGLVVMAAGREILLGQPGSDVIVKTLITPHPNRQKVENFGSVDATGGQLVLAAGDVFSNAIENVGDLAAIANRNITFEEKVISAGSMTVTADLDADGSGNFLAKRRVKTTNESNGDMVISGENITFRRNVNSKGSMTLTADRNNDGSGDVLAKKKVKTTNPLNGDMVISGASIELRDEVTSTGNMTLTADDGDIEIDGPVYSGAGIEMYVESGGIYLYDSIEAVDYIDLESYYWETVEIEGPVLAGSDIDIYSDGGIYIYDSVESGGSIDLETWWGDIEIDGPVYSGAEMEMYADGSGIYLYDSVESADYMYLETWDGDIEIDGPVYSGAEIEMYAEWGGIYLYDSIEAVDYIDLGSYYWEDTIEIEGPVLAGSDIDIYSDGDIYIYDSVTSEGGMYLETWDGSIEIDGPVYSGAEMEMYAEWGDIYLDDSVESTGYMELETYGWGEIEIEGPVHSGSDIYMYSESWDTIYLDDDVDADGSLTLNANTYAAGDLTAGEDVTFNGELTLVGGDWLFDEDLGLWVWNGDQLIEAATGTITAESWIHKVTPGELYMYGGDPDLAIDLRYDGEIWDDPTVATVDNLYMRGNGDIQISGDITAIGDDWDWWDWWWEYPEPPGPAIWSEMVGGVSIISENGKIYTQDGITDDTLNVTIHGYSDDVTYELGGPQGPRGPLCVDLPYGPGKAAIVLMSKDDLKLGPDSNLRAFGVYQAFVGQFDEFFAAYGDFGSFFDDLEIQNWEEFIDFFEGEIWFFDELFWEYPGISPPDIFDTEELYYAFLGTVEGILYKGPGVDDRAGVGFLDEQGQIIGGHVRDDGEPIDVAIYLASTAGDVELDITPEKVFEPESGIYIEPEWWGEFGEGEISRGTLVLDAYDTVNFDFNPVLNEIFGVEDWTEFVAFAESENFELEDLAEILTWILGPFAEFADFDSFFGDYTALGDFDDFGDFLYSFTGYVDNEALIAFLEDEHDGFFVGYGDEWLGFNSMHARSRTTPTLQYAVDNRTLPFGDNPQWFSILLGGTTYVIHGEGGWVLDNNPFTQAATGTKAAPVPQMQLLGTEQTNFGEAGCPALLSWLTEELEIEEGNVQSYLADTFTYSTDCQPCELAAKLKDFAATLEDPDGTRIAALVQVINEFVSTLSPPSEEQMASIATAFSEHAGDGTHYATAAQWIGTLVEYIDTLNTEMGWSIEQATAFVMDKYGAPITQGDNPALVAYVEAHLAALGG